jgi:Mn2+/Fe2+ NRAMP family transporter
LDESRDNQESAVGKRRLGPLAIIGPGLLVAATGVGAGDLAGGSLAGIHVGVGILWAAILGAFLKFVLTEGLARWQLATGQTLLEGAMLRMGRVVGPTFLFILLPWSFFVGSALMGACGATAHAMFPWHEVDAATTIEQAARMDKILYGVLHSVLGVILVMKGGYKLFQRFMSVCIAVMFVTVIVTAVLVTPDWGAVVKGMFWPAIPDMTRDKLQWTIALIGGVGGTLTVLCYGYWIREEGREDPRFLRTCRIDLGVGYIATAFFGMAMLIIGSQVTAPGGGSTLVINLANQLGDRVGPAGKWIFLIGAWGAVFSSLLGVWQAVPLIFADYWQLQKARKQGGDPATINVKASTDSLAYRGYLALLAIVPMLGLLFSFKEIQKFYAIIGAGFIPLLAIVLLIMNGKTAWVGKQYRNRPLTVIVLIITLLLSSAAAWYDVRGKWVKVQPAPPPPAAVTQ